ncbi:hypothetical protein WG66_007185 [Moniliophthora roreri]|uniref:DUF6533 domain-containing protein n=1 Tax=Moniliophthora roreri TaxID=221103 RepID=A0A0W0FFR1_MONRR|nr:hypothetical protein WG66_007185 [Moniliophthora roreri]
MTSTPDPATLLLSLRGAECARNVALASFALNIWDIVTTIDEEIQYFWSGPWTLTRVLFFFNRYLAPATTIIALYCFFGPDLSETPVATSDIERDFKDVPSCTNAIKGCFAMNVIGLTAVQAVLVIRIWYLFKHSPVIRVISILSVTIGAILSAFFVGQSFPLLRSIPNEIPGLRQIGCAIPPPTNFWKLFLPALILHTLLFVLTALRALRTPKVFRDAPLLWRLLRDGGVFYFVVLVIVGYSAISAFFIDIPEINIPAIFSNAMLTITSVAISRLMLNLRSLAARLGYDEEWIFNNVEIERLNWKRGIREGEIIVEVDDHSEGLDTSQDLELLECQNLNPKDGPSSLSFRSSVGVRVTRVGDLPAVQGGMPPHVYR